VFFRIFSPTRFPTRLQVRWYWKDDARGWVLQDTIPIKIVGGRAEGFRATASSRITRTCEWKVQVETTDSREIGGCTSAWRRGPSGREPSRSISSSSSFGRGEHPEPLPEVLDLHEVGPACPGSAALARSGWNPRAAKTRPRALRTGWMTAASSSFCSRRCLANLQAREGACHTAVEECRVISIASLGMTRVYSPLNQQDGRVVPRSVLGHRVVVDAVALRIAERGVVFFFFFFFLLRSLETVHPRPLDAAGSSTSWCEGIAAVSGTGSTWR